MGGSIKDIPKYILLLKNSVFLMPRVIVDHVRRVASDIYKQPDF